jgi:hypothetical protein
MAFFSPGIAKQGGNTLCATALHGTDEKKNSPHRARTSHCVLSANTDINAAESFLLLFYEKPLTILLSAPGQIVPWPQRHGEYNGGADFRHSLPAMGGRSPRPVVPGRRQVVKQTSIRSVRGRAARSYSRCPQPVWELCNSGVPEGVGTPQQT